MNRWIILVLLSLHNAAAYNILAIVSVPLRSHYMAMGPLFRELANRGHHVTVMNNYPDENPTKNLTFIDMKQLIKKTESGARIPTVENMSPLSFYEKLDSSYIQLYNFYRHFHLAPVMIKKDCESFFNNEDVDAHLSKGVKYDVIFVEQFLIECGLAYAVALYDAPIIGITSHTMLPLSYARMGIPFDFSTDSFYFSQAGPNPSLYHKVESYLLNAIYNNFGRMFLQWYIYDVFNHRAPNRLVNMEKSVRERMKMLFVYQHFSLTGARLLAPQLLEIGGLHITQAKPVPEKVEKFLSTAKNGVVYFSFGSNLRASTMSPLKMSQFLAAFKKIPQKVIWKYENDSVSFDKDIYADKWLPQLDVLCHPKVVAFITHGGMLSLSEAAYCGKPVIAIPFFGDQFSNAAAAVNSGLGTVLYFDRLNAETLTESIREITSNKMQQSAKRVSQLWHDRPIPVMDHAIYWTEYVAKHGSSPPSLPSKHASWFEGLLIDVTAVLIGLFLAILLLLYVIIIIFGALIKNCCNGFGKKTKRD